MKEKMDTARLILTIGMMVLVLLLMDEIVRLKKRIEVIERTPILINKKVPLK